MKAAPGVDSGTDDGSDAGVDSGPDGGSDAGTVDEPTRVPPTSFHQPSAAGTASSANHVLRFSIGAPQPMGVSAGAAGTLTLGPNAGGR